MPKTKTRKLIAGIIVLAVLAAYLAYSGFLPRFSLIPGPEGVRAMNYGLQWGLGGKVLKASTVDALPSGFQWTNNQPSILSFKHVQDSGEPSGGFFVNGPWWWYDHGNGEVSSEVQHPMLSDDPVGLNTRQLTYYKYVKVSDTKVEIHKVVVHLIPADFVIQLWIKPGCGVYTFKDINVWYALDTVTWLNAYTSSPPPDPNPLTNDTVKFLSSNYRGAFPIIAWIGQYKSWVFTKDDGTAKSSPPEDAAVGYVNLEPDLSGRFIDLYTSPSSKYSLLLTADVVRNPDLVAQALTPNALPDPRFAETVYFKIRLAKFGAYVKDEGNHYWSYSTWYPSVYYRLRVVYAVYGEYVYLWTAKSAEEVGYTPDTWELRETKKEEYLDPITWFFRAAGAWLSNPINQLWVLLIIIVIVIIVISISSPGIWALLLQRKSGKGK